MSELLATKSYKNALSRDGAQTNWLPIVLFLVYAAFVFMFDGKAEHVRLIYLAYGTLCLYLFASIHEYYFGIEFLFLFGYLIYGLTSVFWTVNLGTTVSRARGLALLLVFLLLSTSYLREYRDKYLLLNSIIVGSVSLSLYVLYRYGLSSILDSIYQEGSRIGSDINNVNAIGNSMSTGAIALISLAVSQRKLYLLCPLAPIGLCFLAAGSRTATISLLVGISVTLLCVVRNEKTITKKALKVILVAFLIAAIWIAIRSIPATRTLVLRLENMVTVFTGGNSVFAEGSAQARMDYIKAGWRQFHRTPLIGNGFGCAGYALLETRGKLTYLHNNYMEILVSGGLLGLILYYAPYLILIIKMLRRIDWNEVIDPVTIVALSLLVARLVGHMGIVTYYSKIEFMLFALWMVEAERLSSSNGKN